MSLNYKQPGKPQEPEHLGCKPCLAPMGRAQTEGEQAQVGPGLLFLGPNLSSLGIVTQLPLLTGLF